MSFPVVQTADTKSGTVTSNSTSWTITYPTNLQSGDLILGLAAIDGGEGYTDPKVETATWSAFPKRTGWNEGYDAFNPMGGADVTLAWGWTAASGNESGTTSTLSLTSSQQGAWRMFRITNWHGDTGLRGVEWDWTGADGNGTGTTSSTPAPPYVNPYNWYLQDTLWVAAMAADTSRTISAFPSNYTTTSSDVSGGAGGATLGVCFRSLKAVAETPGTFTISANDQWVAATIAIRGLNDPWDAVGIPIY